MSQQYCLWLAGRKPVAKNTCETYLQVNVSNEPPTSIERFSFYFNGILGTIIVLVGIISNLLIIFLFTRQRLRACVNLFVVSLAVWDLTLICSSWSQFALSALIHSGRQVFSGPLAFSSVVFHPLNNISYVGCIWTTVALTIDRYLAICQPLKHRIVSTPRRVTIFLACISLGACVFGLPRAFEAQVCMCSTVKGLIPVAVPSHLILSSAYRTAYRVVAQLQFVSAGPFLVLLCLTVFMIHSLHRSSRCGADIALRPTSRSLPGYRTESLNSNGERRGTSRRGMSLRRELFAAMRSRSQNITRNFSIRQLPNKGSIESSQQSTDSDPRCRSPTNERRHPERHVDAALLLVLAKFLFFYSLPTIIDICEHIMGEAFNSRFFIYLVEISNILAVTHSATNLFVYLCFGTKVRRAFLSYLCRERPFRSVRSSANRASGADINRNMVDSTKSLLRNNQ